MSRPHLSPATTLKQPLIEVARGVETMLCMLNALARVSSKAMSAGTEVIREELTLFVEGTPPATESVADTKVAGPAKASPRAFPECLSFLRGLVPEQEIHPDGRITLGGRVDYLIFVFVTKDIVVLASEDPSCAIYVFRAGGNWREEARKKRSVLRKEKPADLVGRVTRHGNWQSRVAKYIN